jgi:2,3-bisphosphoglycerate-dependent phosphoglycerate mutase
MQLYFIRHGQSTNNRLWDQTGSNQFRDEDPGLTETGGRQAQALAEFLSRPRQSLETSLSREPLPGSESEAFDPQNKAGFGLTHLYTSLMVRAVATGTAIARALSLPLVGWADLHEGGGIFLDDEDSGIPVSLPGKTRAFFTKHYPDLILPDWLDEQGWWYCRPFETRLERRQRARRVIDELLARHGNTQDRVALVSHGGFFNHFMAILIGLADQPRQPSDQAKQLLIGDNVILGPERELWFTLNNASISRIDLTPGENRLIYLNRVDFLPDDLIT